MLEVSSVINVLIQNAFSSANYKCSNGLNEMVMSSTDVDGIKIINLMSGSTFYVISFLGDPFIKGENKVILFESAEIRGCPKFSTLLVNGILCIGCLDSSANGIVSTENIVVLNKKINDELILVGLFDKSSVEEIGASKFLRVIGYNRKIGYLCNVYINYKEFNSIVESDPEDLEVTTRVDLEVYEIVERRVK